jgi:hypothetical protein
MTCVGGELKLIASNGSWTHHVRHGEHLRENSRGEERRVLDDNEVALVLKGDTKLGEEAVCRLANDLNTTLVNTELRHLGSNDALPWES